MTTLLDANVLVAVVVADHVHHGAAERWFTTLREPFATCPITQGGLVRLLIREGSTSTSARGVIEAITRDARHEFWPAGLSYAEVPLTGVIGHRQVTDAYLAHLARTRGGRLATFDAGLATLHRDVADLVPAEPPASP